MNDYNGVIIEESLADTAVLEKLRILSTKVEPVTKGHKTPWLSQWTLHTVEVPDERAGEIAMDISLALDPEHGGSWYADFKNEQDHFLIFRRRIFVIERACPAQYEEAKQYGHSLGIPEYQLDFDPQADEWER